MLRLAAVLQDEEMEVLLLAKAANATLLTLDGKLRLLLEHVAEVPGVWPQAVLMHCAGRDLVTPAKRAFATVRQFLTNRSFVSLSPADLTWMVLQGGAYLQQGMQRFKVYLSADSVDFATTARVAFDFLTQIASLQTQFGAFGELFEHVIEAAMRHKRCPPNFDQSVADFIVKLTAAANNTSHPYAPANALSTKRMQLHRRLLAQRFVRVRGRRKALPDKRAIAVRAIFCSTMPSLVEEKLNPTGEAATEVTDQTAEQISPQTALTEDAQAKP